MMQPAPEVWGIVFQGFAFNRLRVFNAVMAGQPIVWAVGAESLRLEIINAVGKANQVTRSFSH